MHYPGSQPDKAIVTPRGFLPKAHVGHDTASCTQDVQFVLEMGFLYSKVAGNTKIESSYSLLSAVKKG
jgi:hypothetical protein